MEARLVIDIANPEGLVNVLRGFKTDSEVAKQANAIEIIDNSDEDTDEDDDPQGVHDQKMLGVCTAVAEILTAVGQQGHLESFRWTGYNLSHAKLTRPAFLWAALGKTAGTLRHLHLQFYVHEIQTMSGFPVGFEKLEALHLDLSGGHGDDATMIDAMLCTIPKLRALSLYLPTCDLESCRIRGITYRYQFPELVTLIIATYTDKHAGLSDFMLCHPSVTSLALGVDGERLDISKATFPGLRALYVMNAYHKDADQAFSNLLSSEAARPIAQLRMGYIPYTYYPQIRKLSKTLRCLEVETNTHAWREPLLSVVTGVLPELGDLKELGVDAPSETITWKDDNGHWVHPDPLNVDDLKALLALLPATSQLRAIRMGDERGLLLPNNFLDELPSVPKSLEYIRWDVSNTKMTYRLKRMASGTTATRCEAVRAISSEDSSLWTNESILDHLQ